jgi:prophage regulatory protein
MPTRSELMSQSIEVIHQQHAIIKHALQICDEAQQIINKQHKIMEGYKDISRTKVNLEEHLSSPESPLSSPRKDKETTEHVSCDTLGGEHRDYLRMNQVAQLLGVARSTVFKYIKEKGFPKGKKLSQRLTVYKYSEIQAWLEENLISKT